MPKSASRKTKSSSAKKKTKAKSKKTIKRVSRGAKSSRTVSSRKTSKVRSQKTSKPQRSKPAQNYSIVRIMGKGQYKLAAPEMAKLNRIDNSIVKFVENHHDSDPATEAQFLKQLNEMIDIVTSKGIEIHPRELVSSDIILPFVDTTLEEARALFKGEGLIPG